MLHVAHVPCVPTLLQMIDSIAKEKVQSGDVITIDKASGITNDPNDWCKEHNNPHCIVDLLKRVTRVSLETMKIVNGLPSFRERS